MAPISILDQTTVMIHAFFQNPHFRKACPVDCGLAQIGWVRRGLCEQEPKVFPHWDIHLNFKFSCMTLPRCPCRRAIPAFACVGNTGLPSTQFSNSARATPTGRLWVPRAGPVPVPVPAPPCRGLVRTTGCNFWDARHGSRDIKVIIIIYYYYYYIARPVPRPKNFQFVVRSTPRHGGAGTGPGTAPARGTPCR